MCSIIIIGKDSDKQLLFSWGQKRFWQEKNGLTKGDSLFDGPYCLVFIPLYNPLPLTVDWTHFQWIKYNRINEMSLTKLEKKILCLSLWCSLTCSLWKMPRVMFWAALWERPWQATEGGLWPQSVRNWGPQSNDLWGTESCQQPSK